MSVPAKLRTTRTRLPFLLVLSAHTNLWRHKAIAILTVLAVGAGAALASSLEVASRSLRHEFQSTADALIGSAELEIVASERSIPEELIGAVASVPGVLVASPIIQETFIISEGPLSGRALHALGVDLQQEHQVRDYDVTLNGIKIRDPLLLLGNQNSVVISEKVTTRMGLEEHDEFQVRTTTGAHTLVVEGLLTEGGLASAYAGQIAIMDVWSLQMMLGARGWVDKIEIIVSNKADPDIVLAALRNRVAGIATVQHLSARESWIDPALRTVDLCAWGATVLGIIIAGLLAYVTISYIATSRAEEFAIMQCAGMDPWTVRAVVVLDGIILSGLGSVLGTLAGIKLAPLLLHAFSQISEHVRRIGTDETTLGLSTIAVSIGVWITIGVLGSLQPALRASRRDPLEVLYSSRIPADSSRMNRGSVLAFGTVLVLLLLISLIPMGIPAKFRLGMVLTVGLTSAVLMSGQLALLFVRWVHSHPHLIPRLGSIIGTSSLVRPATAGMSIGAIAGVACGITMLFTVIDSVTSSIDEWLGSHREGAVMVYATDPSAGLHQEIVRSSTLEAIAKTPGVEDVAAYYNSFPLYQGEEILVGSLASEVLLQRGGFELEETPAAELAAALSRGEVAISHAFRQRFGLDVGDSLELETRVGLHSFQIGGIFRDYSGPAGSVHMDTRTFDQFFHRPGAHFLGIWASRPVPELIDDIVERTSASQPLFFRHGEEVEKASRSVVARYRHLLNALLGVFVVFSAVALVNLLTGGVLTRQNQLALMQIVGASPGNVVLGVLIDALAIAVIGGTIGVVLGIVAGNIATDWVFERFGWVVDYRVASSGVLSIAVATLVLSVLAGILPASIAGRASPATVLRQE